MLRHFLSTMLLLFCISCTNNSDTAKETKQNTGFKAPIGCSKSPPILDKDKIIILLKNNGTITEDMEFDEVEKIVSDFINKKNKSYKEC